MNGEILAQVKGTGGIVYVYSDHVVISRKSITGFIEKGIKGDKTIYFKDIKAIEYKKPTFWANGYIQFVTNMELAANQKVGILGTKLEALKDPNAVILRAIKKKLFKMEKKSIKLLCSNGKCRSLRKVIQFQLILQTRLQIIKSWQMMV